MESFLEIVKKYFFFELLDFWGFPLLFCLLIFLLLAETYRQLRARKEERWSRIKVNVAIAVTALGSLRLILIPALVLLASWTELAGIGLLNWLELPGWLTIVLGFLLLDYGNYLWHVLNHQLPLLWRFHNVHHIDLDLDVTTAVRFHFGEIVLSVFFRGLIIVLIGAPALLVLVYEVIFEAATNFHHSNWRIPYAIEKRLSWLVVTPRMHGIHHSIVKKETDSNYSVIFSCWDRIHRTIRLNIPQKEINIGVPSYRNAAEQTFINLLLFPFKKQRPWQLPDGSVPERESHTPKNHLVP